MVSQNFANISSGDDRTLPSLYPEQYWAFTALQF